MIDPLLILPILVSFIVSLLLIPAWIKKAHGLGLVGKDIHKFKETYAAEAGGVNVLAGFIIGVLVYVALKTFHYKSNEQVILIFALLTSILLISFVGLVDGILGWKKGLSKRVRMFFVLFGAVPLIVINAGHQQISVLSFNNLNLGIIYSLIFIPLGVVGASTTFNFLAGYNGLEARQGILVLSALALAAFLTGSSWLAIAILCMVASLIAFLLFNSYPSKVFPGDVITYGVGGLIAISAILGNMEKFALFIFIPYFIEIILKLRGKLKKESFASVQKDNSLELRYPNIYGLEHFAIYALKKIKKKVYEEEVVAFINVLQIIVILIAFLVFQSELF